MSSKPLSPAASIAAVALHDYAKTAYDRPPSKDLDIRHDTAVLSLDDTGTDEEHDGTPPPPRPRRASIESLGTVISSKAMSKREPLPMKLRALPRSFWEQPNTNQSPSPGYLFAPLPPLTREETMPQGADSNSGTANRSLSSSSSSSNGLEFLPSTNSHRATVSPADTDLLFSLFRAVEKREHPKKASTVRRGRPRRGGGSQHQQRQIRDEDPCLVSSVTEQLLPALTGSRTTSTPVLRMVSLRAGPGSGLEPGNETLVSGAGTVALPCLQVNASYSQILSELVVKL